MNINIPKSDKAKARSKAGATGLLLPPPPGGPGAGGVKPPQKIENNNTVGLNSLLEENNSKIFCFQIPGTSNLTPLSSPVESRPVIGSSNVDLLCDLGGGLGGLQINPAPTPGLATAAVPSKSDDPWGDFATADNDGKSSGNWVQF